MFENGYVRVASAIPAVSVADCKYNTEEIKRLTKEAASKNADIILFPELSITSYTCGDLFAQSLLLDNAINSLIEISDYSKKFKDLTIIVGVPLKNGNRLYNCAVVIQNGEIEGISPKEYIPNYSEFYEKRWFSSASDCHEDTINLNNKIIPFSAKIIYTKGSARIFTELCEDLWVPIPPSSAAAMSGANLIFNLSATDEVIGKHSYLMSLISQQSARLRCAYVYSSAGFGESSTDLVFAGNAVICEDGNILSKSDRFLLSPQLMIADIDIEKLENDRLKMNSFSDGEIEGTYKKIVLSDTIRKIDVLHRSVDAHPFIPSNKGDLNLRCEEIINIQTAGLVKRLQFTNAKSLVVGISGGLDSTLALLIAIRAFDKLGLDRKGIYGITMPGFGTTDRTYTNAITIMQQLEITIKEISIASAVLQHFKDIEHDSSVTDITYENSQARERTQILMDYANKVGGMVLGTGDLSELALGWATYNGDHMSMYGVNASVPKTLVKYLVEWIANENSNEILKNSLLDIVDTPISPELIPAKSDGTIKQKTENLVGPYELHDFFLYNCIRNGYSPRKIFYLAKIAFGNDYTDDSIKFWLKNFYKRFFSQQFKRSCLPDGPKVGSITLSPRGDWRMPSDASSSLWLNQCSEL